MLHFLFNDYLSSQNVVDINHCQLWACCSSWHSTQQSNTSPVPGWEPCWNYVRTWWRHQMETFSALLAICVGNSPVNNEFPTQRPVTRSFDVFFDLRLNKRLSKHSWGWWPEAPSRQFWRQCNELAHFNKQLQHVWIFDNHLTFTGRMYFDDIVGKPGYTLYNTIV